MLLEDAPHIIQVAVPGHLLFLVGELHTKRTYKFQVSHVILVSGISREIHCVDALDVEAIGEHCRAKMNQIDLPQGALDFVPLLRGPVCQYLRN